MADYQRTSTEKEYTDLIDQYVAKGYEIISSGPRTTELIKRKEKKLHKKLH